MKNAKVVVNLIILLGILLTTYFLHASLTPDGYTGRILWFTYDVHSPRNPAIVLGILVLALLLINWRNILQSRKKGRILIMSMAIIAILAGIFFFLSYKRHNRMPWERPNILLVVVDTLRADHVGAYGAGYAKTPNIDALAADGWLFENAYSHIPITLPSHSSLFSSRLPHEVYVLNNTDLFNYPEQTLTEVLKSEGYRTGAMVSLGVLRKRHRLNRGFDTYDDSFPRTGRWFQYAEVITDRGIAWLEENAGAEEPFFLWLHYQDPHEPYSPPTEVYARDTELNLNGEVVASIKLESAENIDVPLTLKPGRNRLLIKRLGGDLYRLYFTTFHFRDFEINDFPPEWESQLANTTGRDRVRELRKLQENRFFTDFNRLSFGGLRFGEGAGWAKPTENSRRPRREIEEEIGEMFIVNDGSEDKQVTLRLKGGLLKQTDQVWRDYAAEAEYNDFHLGRLFTYLEEKGLKDNTIIVLMSDHGEELNEHCQVGHIQYLYTQSLHVPLIIRDPDSEQKGVRTDRLARIIDIAPTILDMAGLHQPTAMEGRTLMEFILKNRSDPRTLYCETFRDEARVDRVGIREEDRLLIYNPELERLRTYEYYDLKNDPLQWRNLVLTKPGNGFNEMTSRAEALWKSMELSREFVDIDDEQLEMLQDLGYIQGGAEEMKSGEERGEPEAVAIEAAIEKLHEFEDAEFEGTIASQRVGGDGPFYLVADIVLKANEEDVFKAMMALADHVQYKVMKYAAPFPIRLRVEYNGKPLYDRVLAPL